MDRHADSARRTGCRAGRWARRRASRLPRPCAALRGVRARRACVRRPDEAEPRPSRGAAACRGSRRRRTTAGAGEALPGLPAAHGGRPAARLPRPHLQRDRAAAVEPVAARHAAFEVPAGARRRVPGRRSRPVRAVASARATGVEAPTRRGGRSRPVDLRFSRHRSAPVESRFRGGVRHRDPTARRLPPVLAGGVGRGRASSDGDAAGARATHAARDVTEALESALASSLCGVGPRTISRLRAYARERSRPLKKAVDRVMYSLAARDPERYPLPWGGDAPAGRSQGAPQEARPEADFMAFLSAEELDALHRAMVVRGRLLGRARTLPVASLAYAVLIEGGAVWRLLGLGLSPG